jgi:hypothetical protein
MSDGLKCVTDWYIHKWKDPNNEIAAALQKGEMSVEQMKAARPDAYLGMETQHGNIATTDGIKAMIYFFAGTMSNVSAPASTNQFNNANAYMVVGTSSAAPAQANNYASFGAPVTKAMDAGFPSCSAASPWVVTWQSTYANADAVQAWNEFGIGNTNAGAVMLNRVTSSKGSKPNNEAWTMQVQITYS